jgi:hypothetical protein
MVDGGGVGENADPQAVEARRGDQAVGSEQHREGPSRRLKLRSCYGSRRRGRPEELGKSLKIDQDRGLARARPHDPDTAWLLIECPKKRRWRLHE